MLLIHIIPKVTTSTRFPLRKVPQHISVPLIKGFFTVKQQFPCPLPVHHPIFSNLLKFLFPLIKHPTSPLFSNAIAVPVKAAHSRSPRMSRPVLRKQESRTSLLALTLLLRILACFRSSRGPLAIPLLGLPPVRARASPPTLTG